MNDNNGLCQCLYELENNLTRTQHCFMPCEAQKKILAARIKTPSVLLVTGSEPPINNTIQTTLEQMYALGIKHAIDTVQRYWPDLQNIINHLEKLKSK